jgi:outer membrane protein OmpA-like peptidoglycan-associated protein
MKLINSVLLLFVVTLTGFSQDKYTAWSVEAGLGLSWNVYYSNFADIPGYESCCTNYSDASGFGPKFFGGIFYNPRQDLFGIDYQAGFRAGYGDISASYAAEDFIGYIITGNEYTKATVEHQLDASVSGITLKPYIRLYPIDGIHLSADLGFEALIPMTNNLAMKEVIVAPPGVTYDNGTTEQNPQSGEITGFAGMLAFITGSLRYDVYKFGDFILSPEIGFSYGLNNFAEGLDWKAYSFNAGLAIAYNIPKAELAPPLPPPMPGMPAAPIPDKTHLAVGLSVGTNGKEILNAGMIDITFEVSESRKEYSVLPLVFFADGSPEINYQQPASGINSYLDAQQNALYVAIQHLKEDSRSKITILGSSNKSEAAGIGLKRAESLASILKSNGIAGDRISIKETAPLEQANPLTADEGRKAEILIDGKSATVKYSKVESVNSAQDVEFSISPSVNTNSEELILKGEVLYGINEMKLGEFPREASTFVFKASRIQNLHKTSIDKYLTFRLKASAGEIKADTSIRVYLDSRDLIRTSKTNEITLNDKNYEQYILAYFNFDDTRYSLLDSNVIKKINDALVNGQEVTIYPLTDNIGSAEYNKDLAESRAKSVLPSLANGEKVKIEYPEDHLFPNDTPWGRILNRTVLVRISK